MPEAPQAKRVLRMKALSAVTHIISGLPISAGAETNWHTRPKSLSSRETVNALELPLQAPYTQVLIALILQAQ